VFFTLSMIRRHLEELGHGYKLSEIKEALDILARTFIEIRLDSDAVPGQSKRRRFCRVRFRPITPVTLRKEIPLVKIPARP
jgi:hypothetical protein